MKDNFLTRLIKPKNSNPNNLPIESLRTVPLSDLHSMRRYGNDEYDNGFSSVRAIADSFLQIKIYGIEDNGKKIEKTPNALRCVARPNSDMSSVDFKDALATKTLVYDKTYVLVHERDGRGTKPASERVREDRIAGYTFLEGVVEDTDENGHLVYKVWIGTEEKRYYPYQVMVFKDINPSSLAKGYSPSRAARRWSRIEDYIADYQAGFFENGAVPAGQFLITAPTTTEFDNIVDNLEKKHKGAGANNNVVYTYQPIDPNSGKPSQATITWVPFNTTNKDLSLKDILEATNSKTDSVYRVSAMQRAITDAPNYATAQVDDRNFALKTMYPFTLKRWQRFQHELNRITGGLGYGISFEFEVPHVAEEEKTKADTNLVIWNTIKDMMDKGFTYDSACNALKLPANWKLLEVGEDTKTVIENDKSDVVEENSDTPTPEIKQSIKVRNEITEEDRNNYEQQLKAPTAELMSKQIEHAIASLDPVDNDPEATEEDKDTWVDEMMAIILTILLVGGIDQWDKGRRMLEEAGIDAPTTEYIVTEAAENRYREYLKTIADSYTNGTATAIRNVLDRSEVEGWSRGEIEKNLRNINSLDQWRVDRLAKTEVNRSGALSSVEAMIGIKDETGADIEQSLKSTSGNPCVFCQQFIGKWIKVGDVMVEKGATITAEDGSVFVNNWDTNYGHDVHANGNCVPEYRVAGSVQNKVKLEAEIAELKSKLEEADGRTKEAKELKAKLAETEEYAKQLENILDGQG